MVSINLNYKSIYEPAEDSKLLLKHSILEIEKFVDKLPTSCRQVKLDILEIGIGSGFVISNLEKKFKNNNFFGTDINLDAINYTKKNCGNINLKFGNLFEPFKEKKFDLILFNTPYFPIEFGDNFEKLSLKDRAIYGGEKGWETIVKFIIKSENYFNSDGFGIMIFSSLSNFDFIKEVLEKKLFDFEILEEKNYFFEKIYCIKFYPLKILKKLKLKKISQIKFLAKGRHSIVLDGEYLKKNCIIKIGLEKDIQIENEFLEILKNESFVPKLFISGKKFSVREKIEGENIKEFLEREKNINKIIFIINEILKICKFLDEKKINKKEMGNPYKHIFIIKNKKIKMIDYERCLFTLKPKNITQFLQYLKRNINLLKTKKIFLDENKIFEISKKYKKKIFEIKFNELFYSDVK